MESILPYTAALVLGTVHALEADHMAAVTSFAIRKPAPLAAARFGMQWAVGHGASLLLAGSALLLIGLAIPETASIWLDRLVAFVLIGLGVWTLRSSNRLRAHVHVHAGREHVHLHPEPAGHDHDHPHAPTMVGMLHGMAGAAPALALLNVTGSDSVLQGVSAMMIFALGTAVGMGGYALCAGFIAGRAAIASEKLARAVGRLTGVGTIIIGIYWLFR